VVNSGPDFFSALLVLLDQIPDDMVTFLLHLASAMGDPVSEKAVNEALKRQKFHTYRERVVPEPDSSDSKVFSEFRSKRLLEELAEYQEERKIRVVITPLIGRDELIAGVDASYEGDAAYASCVVMNRDLEIVDSASTAVDTRFPYIPGYLSFREAPGLLSAVSKVSGFDVLMVNGHGVAHPRRCGLASWVGIEINKPTIDVAKRLLVGEVGKIRGVLTPLIFGGLTVGAEVKRSEGAPIYVSVDHRIDLESAVRITWETWHRGRLPEPLRAAHDEAVAARKRDS
jgi:deoxyribonuclease V